MHGPRTFPAGNPGGLTAIFESAPSQESMEEIVDGKKQILKICVFKKAGKSTPQRVQQPALKREGRSELRTRFLG